MSELLVRRYRCTACRKSVTVRPPDVVRRRLYLASAMALAFALFGIERLAQREVRGRVCPLKTWGDGSITRWDALRDWLGAVREGRLFRKVRRVPREWPAWKVAERAAATLAACGPPGMMPGLRLGGHTGRPRLRWQAERPMALWHGDVCHGPSLKIDGRTKPLRIHAMLDDASRYIVALEAHHTEREVDMLGLMVRALRRHGAPDALYLDNGSTYRGVTLATACARIGTALMHARPYDAPARGKMERFWRTLREGCLDFMGDVSTLHDVNVRLWAFLDTHYHQAAHASLLGQTPSGVFKSIEQRPDGFDDKQLRDALTVRQRRRVHADGTVAIEEVAHTSLVEGVNVLSAAISIDHSNRFHRYVVLSQTQGTDENRDKTTSTRGEAVDREVTCWRSARSAEIWAVDRAA